MRGCPHGRGATPASRSRRRFTQEFKRDAVELVRATGRPIAQIARELGVYDSTLGTGSARTASTVARPRG
jgi:transposase-like protein